ncbi:MAG TPA: hypothetical protein VGI12_13800 [Vicinamibacterales bacterium]
MTRRGPLIGTDLLVEYRRRTTDEPTPLRTSNGTRARRETDYDQAAHVVNLRVVFK